MEPGVEPFRSLPSWDNLWFYGHTNMIYLFPAWKMTLKNLLNLQKEKGHKFKLSNEDAIKAPYSLPLRSSDGRHFLYADCLTVISVRIVRIIQYRDVHYNILPLQELHPAPASSPDLNGLHTQALCAVSSTSNWPDWLDATGSGLVTICCCVFGKNLPAVLGFCPCSWLPCHSLGAVGLHPIFQPTSLLPWALRRTEKSPSYLYPVCILQGILMKNRCSSLILNSF